MKNEAAGSRERAAAIQSRTADRRSRLSDEARAALARRLRRKAEPEAFTASIPRRDGDGPIPLSLAQERLWFLEQMDPAQSVFHMPCALRCRGRFVPAALRGSVGELLRRHEVLRSTFTGGDGAPLLRIRPEAEPELPVLDLAGLPTAERERELERLLLAESSRPFDLERDLPLRTRLLRLAADDHVILAVMHHLVSDAWSLGVLARELMALYEAFATGHPSPLPELPVQYPDFAVWQREWLQGDVLASLVSYWRERLAGVEPLSLPTDRPRPAVRRFHGGQVFADLGPSLSEAVRRLALQEEKTLFITLLAAFQVLLHRIGGQTDVTVGAFTGGRTRLEVEGLIGFFVNNLVLRTDLAGRPSFRDALRRTAETAAGAFSHQDLPFERLLQELAPERLLSSTPLFQVLFHLDDEGAARDLRLPGLDVSFLSMAESFGRFDLTLVARVRDTGLQIGFEYDRDLFDDTTASRLVEHLRILLAAAADRPGESIAALPLLAPWERQQLVCEWNDTAWRARHPAVVPAWFERQVESTPEMVAAVFGAECLTYRQLDGAANRLARHLRRRGAGPDTAVGIYVERSLDLAVGVLGILKAGAAYVPLDPSYPKDRLAYMLADAGARVLVTHESLAGTLPVGDRSLVLLDRDREILGAESAEPLASGLDPDHRAYVIYTSGSTGLPKGIALSHLALTNLLEWHLPALLGGARTLQFAALSFDASFHEMFAAWYTGGTLVIVPEALRRDMGGLLAFLEREQVEKAILPVVVLHQLAEEILGHGAGALSLREITTTGEALQVNHAVVDLFRRLTEVPLHNHYGPSESHVVTAHTLRGEPGDWPGVPSIGRPIFNSQVHLLDPLGQPVPVGVAGELFIGGLCLFRGYGGRPELTAEKLVPDPFAVEAGARLYRTGDLARWRADGTVDFLGRMDHQLKIRGFRVEPGEIETVLGRHPGVREAVAMAREIRPGDRQLVAYVVPEPGAGSLSNLRSYLAEWLPDHMVPAFLVHLDELPLTPSGKVDRRALPTPVVEGTGGDRVPPRTPVEEILAALWAELLDVPKVGVHDDFFSLGGHSLLATRLVSRMRRAFSVELPLRALFEARTVAGLAAVIERTLHRGEAAEPPLAPVPRDGALPLSYPLSYPQQRLWFLDQLGGSGSAYNIPLALRLSGDLDPRLLAAGFTEVVHRHEALRTVFAAREDEPVQVILPAPVWDLPLIDLSVLEEDEREATARTLAAEDALRPFDLSRGPLLRTFLLRLGPSEHLLLVDIHHIVADGWSLGVLVRETVAVYTALRRGEPVALPPLPVQYADYAVWQRSWLRGEVLELQMEYWRRRLAGASALLELPLDRPRAAVQSYRGASEPFHLAPDAARALEELGRRQGATFFMVLAAALAVLLRRWSDQDDLVLGSPIANRTRQEVEGLIGFFVNTLALRIDLAGDPAFPGLLDRFRQTALDAYAHQDLPFEKLVEELQPARDMSHHPVFQVMLVLQNVPLAALEAPGLTLRPLEVESATAKFDVLLLLHETVDGWAGMLEYSTDLFDRSTMLRLLGHFGSLVREIAADPARPISEIPVLGAAERHQVVAEWSDTDSGPLVHSCVHHLFEEQAARTPGAVAVELAGERLTYRDLDRRANRLARLLRRLGAGPDVPVGIGLESSLGMAVAVLGVLKSGAPYVPLDPGYPADRLAYMLEDAGAATLITRRHLSERLSAHGIPVLFLEEIEAELEREEDTTPESGAAPDHLAYVIYTSGSTGRPKGIGLPHRALVNLIEWHLATPGLLQGARTVQFASLGFDASFHEMFAAWASGGTVLLLPEGMRRDVPGLLSYLERTGAEKAILPVVVLQQMAEDLLHEPGRRLPLREITTTGEQLRITRPVVDLFLRHPELPLHNHYGPSESHVVTAATLGPDPGSWPAIPSIGRPIASSQTYVLDRHLRPLPLGVLGELFLGGACLARGYQGRADLTAEKFVPDPLGKPGSRLYRTGDLARFRPDGSLDFFGRIDHQVKIRGIRIEPGEVEAALLRHPEIREAVVLAREDRPGERRLVAYVVAGAEPPAPAALRAVLAESLPEAMIPSAFVALEKLPLTQNGKVDRRALPAPDLDRPASGAPRTPAEELVAGVWASVLGVERIGVEDDFFLLGGHSLLATRAMARLGRAFGLDLPVRTLFQAPTVEALARAIEAAGAESREDALPPLRLRDDRGPAPLSFAQERLWFLDRMAPGSAAYNLPAPTLLRGPLDPEALERSLAEMVRRHEAVRTVFEQDGDRPVQRAVPFQGWSLPRIDLGGLPEAVRDAEVRRLVADEVARPFDLAAGPLLRNALVRSAPEEHLLLLGMHHIVSDGWSMEVLVREVAALYRAFFQGEASPLAELPVQYSDFAVWQRSWLSGEVLERQLEFWRGRLAGVPALELPLDRPRPAVPTWRGDRRGLGLAPDVAARLKEVSRSESATLFMTALAAFQVLLQRYTGEAAPTVGSPVANRRLPEIEGLIGFFVNTLVFRGDLAGEPTFRELLARVRQGALDAYAHQDLPFERLVEALQPRRDTSRHPLFQVMLAVQSFAAASAELPGASLEPWDFANPVSRFDWTLWIVDEGTAPAVWLEYATDLFDAATAERALRGFERLLSAALEDPSRPVAALPLLGDAESHQVRTEWNDSRTMEEPAVPAHRMVEEWAAKTPTAVAVASPEMALTYAELNLRADRLACRLLSLGVGPESRVGLLLDRVPALIVSILATWKAGGAYVPMDPSYPAERIAAMLEDAGLSALVTRRETAAAAAVGEVPQIVVDAAGEEMEAGSFPEAPRLPGICEPDLPAYVIYTSGSTGRPKGVVVTHRSLANLILAARRFEVGPGSRVLQFCSPSFDPSVMEISVTLSGGATLFLDTEPNLLPGPELVERLEELAISHLLFTTAGLAAMPEAPLPSLHTIGIGGEACPPELVPRWGTGRRLFNLYGPTESTIFVTRSLLREPSPRAPIGRPVANARVHLVDQDFREVPPGVAGELLVGGPGLARGYLRRPAETAERFVPDPFGEPGGRLYRTGDLARHRADGEIEFLGRRDQQVKVRGFRVEPGEIEAMLGLLPGVARCAVAVRRQGAGDARLIAWVVPAGAPAPLPAALRNGLREMLPPYMLPADFVFLDDLPLTPGGNKVDYRALPDPDRLRRNEEIIPPRTPTEAWIAGTWQRLLGLDRVGADDDFFDLGGHSLLAAQMISRIRQELGLDVPVRLLFESPTVEGLARAIEAVRWAAAPARESAADDDREELEL